MYRKDGTYYEDDGTQILVMYDELPQYRAQVAPSLYEDYREAGRAEARPVYRDSYGAEKKRVQAQLDGRAPFRWDAGADPMYRDYRDRYVQEGRLAMRDSMGRAAALTGGYGSSYSQSVGQQSFDTYLRRLGEVIPTLYGMAYERWKDEGEALRQRLEGLERQEQREYSRYRDEVADFESEREYARQLELEDYRRMAAQESEDYKRRADEEKSAYTRQKDAYANLYKAIKESGYRPTQAELDAAGMSRAAAEAVRKEYWRGANIDEREITAKEVKNILSGGGRYGGGAGPFWDPVLEMWYYEW